MFLTAFLFAASQPASVIPTLSDDQLCQALQRGYAKAEGMQIGPATILKSGPNCRAKMLNNYLAVAVSGPQRQIYVSTFMANAEANLCHSTAPTVLAFKARHWRWTYDFKFADGSVVTKKLACLG